MTEAELFDLMKEIDPETKRVPIGIMRLVVKLEERIRADFAASAQPLPGRGVALEEWSADVVELLQAIHDETECAPCNIKAFQPSLDRMEWASVAAKRLLYVATCDACEGQGNIDANSFDDVFARIRCFECDGTGRRHFE